VGTEQGLSLAARVLFEPGQTVWLEGPAMSRRTNAHLAWLRRWNAGLGYLIAPLRLAEAFAGARLLAVRHGSGGDQAVLAEFMEGGHFDAHIRRLVFILCQPNRPRRWRHFSPKVHMKPMLVWFTPKATRLWATLGRSARTYSISDGWPFLPPFIPQSPRGNHEMTLDLAGLNWLAILACIVAGQIVLTVWFAVIFADPWAKAYGVADKAQHTAEVPKYTYGIGLVCMALLTLGLAIFQKNLGITGVSDGLSSGLFVAVMFCVATVLPGYAFLRRWSAFILAISAQIVVILVLSVILAVWA
jgi:hypothetical protein